MFNNNNPHDNNKSSDSHRRTENNNCFIRIVFVFKPHGVWRLFLMISDFHDTSGVQIKESTIQILQNKLTTIKTCLKKIKKTMNEPPRCIKCVRWDVQEIIFVRIL